MLGNVFEWGNDWYGSYSEDAQTNPQGPPSGEYRVLRGGGWVDDSDVCRASVRYHRFPVTSNYFIGFRVARTP